MWIKIVWHWVCILIFLSGLIDLLLSRGKVFYESGLSTISDTFQIAVCLKIDSTFHDCLSLEGESLVVCEKLKQYFEYVEDGQSKSPREIIQRFSRIELPATPLFNFSDEHTISKQYNFLNMNHLCTLYKVNVTDAKKENFEFFFFNNFHLSLKFFLFSGTVDLYLRYEHLTCKNFDSCLYFNMSLTEYKSSLLQSSTEADCFDYSSKNFHFQKSELIDSRSSCLQECFKYQERYPEFFYTENDDLPIRFNRDENYELLRPDHIKHCRGQCSKPSCITKTLKFRGLVYNRKQNIVTFNVGNYSVTFKAKPYIRTFSFWRKSLGFLSLFFRISILSLALKVNTFLRNKRQQANSRKRALFSIALVFLWLVLVSCFFYGSFLVRLIYDKYKETTLTPYVYYEVPFVPNNFSIALCETVSHPNDSGVLPLSGLKEPAKRFDSTEHFVVKFGYKEENLALLNGRFFYRSQDAEHLEHCFSGDVHIKEPR